MEIDDLTRKQVDLKSALTEQKNENQDLFERLEAAAKESPRRRSVPEREGLTEQMKHLRDENEKLKSYLDDLKLKKKSTERALEVKDAQIDALQEDIDRANSNHNDMIKKLQNKERELSDILARPEDRYIKPRQPAVGTYRMIN